MKEIYRCIPVDGSQPVRYLQEQETYFVNGVLWVKPAVWCTKEQYEEYIASLL